MEGDSLVTVSVGPDNNKVVRKYELTEDGVLLVRSILRFLRHYKGTSQYLDKVHEQLHILIYGKPLHVYMKN